jgi:very-short-patch-repair endonuclease
MPPLLRPQTFRARAQRRASTPAEVALWSLLRARRVGGAKFRRHQPLGPLIVDFVCFDAGLVVEVDGGYHLRPEVAQPDAIRDDMLRAAGFDVLRLTNEEVLQRPDLALARIRARLRDDALPPLPPGEGGRGGEGIPPGSRGGLG